MILKDKKKEDFIVDFIGIGIMKAGSTWIFEVLKEHPQICVSTQKEIQFFDKDRNYIKGIGWYKKFFSNCQSDKIKGEFSPGYLSSPKVPERIYNNFPKAKLIVCLRNPVEAIISCYRFSVTRRNHLSLYPNFSEAIHKDKGLLDNFLYARHLKRYFSFFSKENILILIYDDLKSNPADFIKKIYNFLNVDSQFIPEICKTKKNVTGDSFIVPRFAFINKIFCRLMILSQNQKIRKIPGFLFLQEIAFRIYTANRKHVKNFGEFKVSDDSIRDDEREYLRQFYKADIEQLEKIIDRKLTSWKIN